MPYPIEEYDIVLSGGLKVHYVTAGKDRATPVVLLHGGGVDSAMLSWKLTIPALADAGYRVYAPDWPGYGNSPPPPENYSMPSVVRWVQMMMNQWDLPKAAMVGVSMGGGAALGAALEYPNRVNRLVLVGSYGLADRVMAQKFSYLYVQIPGFNAFLTRCMGRSRWVARETIKSIMRNPAQLTDELLDDVCAAMRHPHAAKMFGQFQRAEVLWNGLKTSYMSRLGEIEIPVMLVHGTHDFAVPVEFAETAAKHLPNAELHLFENAGHWTQRDAPERFNRVLVEFLGREERELQP